jgi:hypothetical protein
MSVPTDVKTKKEELLIGWHFALQTLQRGNFDAATYYGKLGKRFGVPVVIASSVVSSAIFATLGKSEYASIQIAAGLISLTATVLSALQTFLNYSERSSGHKNAAVGYGDLRTEVQVLMATDLSAIADLDKKIDSIRTRWNALDKSSPTLPAWIYAAAEKAVRDQS